MFSYFKWSSSPGGTKGAELVGTLPPSLHHHETVSPVDRKKLKRKRAGSDRSQDPVQIQRQAMKEQKARLQARMASTRNYDGESTNAQNTPTSLPKGKATIQTSPKNNSALEPQAGGDIFTMEQRVEAQFNLEILLKHREMRLVDQEIAKCQASLEQLRRCHLIPFPATSTNLEAMEHVSNGDGLIAAEGDVDNLPQWSAPWGVTDGPYAKHYAKWLLPDPRFDGHQAEDFIAPSISVSGKGLADPRGGRGSISEGSLANKARPHRGVASSKLHALSNGYPQPKDKSTPLIVKRTSDNVYVKLVCIDCDRGDFSSAQGFINHCRIAHHRGFESHDAAAAACGQPVEVDEHGGVVGVEEANTQGGPPLVHPMIRAATLQQTPPKLTQTQTQAPTVAEPKLPEPAEASTKGSKRKRRNSKTQKGHGRNASIAIAFIPSVEAPFLSAYMEKKGVGGNLDEMVEEAQKKEDFEPGSSDEEDDGDNDDEEDATNAEPAAPISTPPARHLEADDDDDRLRVARTPGRAGMSPAPLIGRPNSSKGVEKGSRKPGNLSSVSPHQQYALPVSTNNGIGKARAHRLAEKEVVEFMDHDTPVNLSPNTLESQTAPSLVSDDDDYEAHSESASSPSSAGAEDEVLVEVEDSDESETSVTDSETAPSAVNRRRGALRGSNGRADEDRRRTRKEDRHVSFVSPAKEPVTRAVARRSNRKR